MVFSSSSAEVTRFSALEMSGNSPVAFSSDPTSASTDPTPDGSWIDGTVPGGTAPVRSLMIGCSNRVRCVPVSCSRPYTLLGVASRSTSTTSATCQLVGSVFGCTIGTGKLPGSGNGAAAPPGRLPKPQAPSRGRTGAARNATPSAGPDEPAGVMLISIAAQRSEVPGRLAL